MCQQIDSGSFENVPNKLSTYKSYIFNIYIYIYIYMCVCVCVCVWVCVNRMWHYITFYVWYTMKPNQLLFFNEFIWKDIIECKLSGLEENTSNHILDCKIISIW